MRRFAWLFLLLILTASAHVFAYADDVYVDGYYRGDGTYVRPHYRSSPDGDRSNNYGPSRSSSELLNPRSRDADRDGVPNYLDRDDNNNGILDNNDSSQYRQGW